jgi:hypothetical protein
MRKLLLVLCVILFSASVEASPFLVCDPQVGVTHYKLTGPAWVPKTVLAESDGSIRMDVAPAPAGTSSLTVAACRAAMADWPVEECSDYVPFDLRRPAAPIKVIGIKITN